MQAVNKDNSGTIILQYDCLIGMTGYKGTVLKSVVETYFDYGGLRIEMISQLIDIDINMRKLKLQQERQSATIQNLERSKEQSATKSYVKEPRLLLKSNLIQAFRATETIALENLFHLVAAYR